MTEVLTKKYQQININKEVLTKWIGPVKNTITAYP